MPAVVTHTAILLLAKARLRDVRDVLDGRIRRYPAGQRPLVLEQRLRDLAAQALDYLNTAPLAPPDLLGGEPFGSGVSKLAIMGAMGPDIPAFSNALQPGQAWPFDTIHKATPDEHRERVIARTTDFALEIWTQARTAILSEVAAGQQEAALARVRAYVLGHLCHLAGDIVSHPFINDLEWHLGTDAQSKLSHQDGEMAHDAAAAQRIFGRAGVRAGRDWEDAWPKPGAEVPEQLFAAYSEAVEAIYRARSDRQKGFGEFERVLALLEPPPLDTGFVRDGYELLRGGIVRLVYGHGTAGWALLLTPLMLPVIALPFLALVLPGLRFLPLDGGEVETERKVFELVAHALYPAALSGVFYQGMLMSLTMRGVEKRQIASLIATILTLAFAVLFYVESGRQAWSPATRWSLLFALPLVINGILGGFAFADFRRKTNGAHRHRRRFATTLLPGVFTIGMFVLWLIFLILFVIVLVPVLIVSGLVDLLGGEGFNAAAPAFWIAAGIWLILGIVAWVWGAEKLRDIVIREEPDLFAAGRRHSVRLFDEETLFPDPAAAGSRNFPSGHRPLARLWWEGEGEMTIRSDRFGLVFRLTHGGAARPDQTVPAPVAPMLLAEYLAFIEAAIVDHAGTAGRLKSRILHAGDDYELPPGATFAAHGDEAGTEVEVREGAARFLPLGATDSATTYVLHHAPKVWQSIRLGPAGPVARADVEREGDFGAIETANGYAYVHDRMAAETASRIDSDSIMSLAGDLGALLCLGAVPHLGGGGAGTERIYQVFRNWSLDRRRVNEWRMLIEGRAWSEKTAPDRYDAAMPQGAHGPGDQAAWRAPIGAAAAAEAEATALGLGWVPALRTWLAVMREAGQDPNATTSLRPGDPTNRALSRAVAWLLDLPEPATRAGG